MVGGRLGSFGNAFEFGTRLVGSLDRRYVGKRPSWRGGNGEGDGTGQVGAVHTPRLSASIDPPCSGRTLSLAADVVPAM